MFFLVEIVKKLEINGVARSVVLSIQMKFKILVIVNTGECFRVSDLTREQLIPLKKGND